MTGIKNPLGVHFRIDASKAKPGANNGTFCTDPMGRTVQSCSLGNSVVQYMALGFGQTYPCHAITNDTHATITGVNNVAICGPGSGFDSGDINEPGGVPPGANN
jgi:hypothetical protein